MQQATYTAAEFVKVGACALLNGVEHPAGVGPQVVSTTVRSYDPKTGVVGRCSIGRTHSPSTNTKRNRGNK